MYDMINGVTEFKSGMCVKCKIYDHPEPTRVEMINRCEKEDMKFNA